MSAVWRASRAAVKRRRLQSIVIGFVVLVSTTTLVVALGLLSASSSPFDQAFEGRLGAHVVADFDAAKTTDAQLARTAGAPGVEAAAGPFGQALLEIPGDASQGQGPQRLQVVGRADPAGPVDRVEVFAGRWATAPGEIVLNENPAGRHTPLGQRIGAPGGPQLTVVGLAYSVSRSADAWVTPAQLTALHPGSVQMLYRFTDHATDDQLSADTSAVTAGLPKDALLGSQSYLVVKKSTEGAAGMFVPFLMLFGILGAVVAVLIVGNVVSGAVVAGYRHIGVLKALGFTPGQVVAVYLTMTSVPALAGCVLGTVLGDVLALPLLAEAFSGFGGANSGVSPWVDVVALLGMPALVALAALLPALRARALSASEAISAGSAPRTGRALRVQRWLSGTRLPRSASLGVGMAFARPARSAMTLAAVILGVTSATMSTGFARSITEYSHAATRSGTVQLDVIANDGRPGGPPGSVPAKLTDPATEALIRGLPGVRHVTAGTSLELSIAGNTESVMVDFFRSDVTTPRWTVLKGKWLDGPGQVEVNADFLYRRGLHVGDSFTLVTGGRSARVVIAGEVLATGQNRIYAGWDTLQLLAPAERAWAYEVQTTPGTNAASLVGPVQAADPGLQAFVDSGEQQSSVQVMIGMVTLLAILLGAVAALGIFNTVVLNTRERRRDLGMLKSIGMTPRQVTAMMVASMATLGVLGGLVGIPFGLAAHRLIVPMTTHAAHAELPSAMLDVFSAPLLILLALAGVGIAALGAYLPARAASRLTIAEVLHTE